MEKRTQDFTYNSSKAERELGQRCRPLTETMADTVRWFRVLHALRATYIDAHEEDLAAALASSAADSARFRLLGFGEGWDVPPLEEEVIQSTSVGECP